MEYGKGSILLVDDEPLVLEMFESVLLHAGYDVVSVSSCREAQAVLRKRTFNILVCDIFLEDLDGFSVAEFAREHHPSIPVILITGRPTDEGMKVSREKGYGYLSKPVPFELLKEKISQSITESHESFKKPIEGFAKQQGFSSKNYSE